MLDLLHEKAKLEKYYNSEKWAMFKKNKTAKTKVYSNKKTEKLEK